MSHKKLITGFTVALLIMVIFDQNMISADEDRTQGRIWSEHGK